MEGGQGEIIHHEEQLLDEGNRYQVWSISKMPILNRSSGCGGGVVPHKQITHLRG
jgi:hypothetical protein